MEKPAYYANSAVALEMARRCIEAAELSDQTKLLGIDSCSIVVVMMRTGD